MPFQQNVCTIYKSCMKEKSFGFISESRRTGTKAELIAVYLSPEEKKKRIGKIADLIPQFLFHAQIHLSTMKSSNLILKLSILVMLSMWHAMLPCLINNE